MKYALIMVLAVFLFSYDNIVAQSDAKSLNYFKKNYSRLNLEYFIFYERELIGCTLDTVYRAKFKRDIANQIKRIKTSNIDEAKERKVFLNILYSRINETKISGGDSIESKTFLLSQISQFKKLNFSVDYKYWETRLNPKRRGMPFGDEECDVDYSLFIFFVYNPELYLKVITESKVANPSGKIIFPNKCFLEELSYFPLDIKKRTQTHFLEFISSYKGANFDLLRKKIEKADLSAHYD